MTEKTYITKSGFDRAQEELRRLKTVERPSISEAISAARELGDLKENAEYHAAREKQSFVEGRIIELEGIISTAEVIDPASVSGDTVKFGARVTLYDEESDKEVTYRIVGEYEADIEKGLISIKSPVARALIGKKAEDEAVVETPRGFRTYEIISVAYSA
ncbi:MAG: transcription elongation factor GreA [Rickettsiales bacterium]